MTGRHAADPTEERFYRVVFYLASLLWDAGAAEQVLSTLTDVLTSAIAADKTNGDG
jgi:hypothetical protein